MYTFFQPKPGRYGIVPNLVTGRCQTTIANSGDTTFSFGGHPSKCYLNRAVVSAKTVPVSSGGTILGLVKKYDAAGNTAVTLSGSVDLEALTANTGTAIPFLSSLTDAQRTLNPGDTIQFVVTTNNTVGTAAVDLYVNTELLVLE